MDYLPFLTLIGSVALLMYGMKVMSEGLQKMAGSQLRKVLGAMTTNRFTGLLTGAFITTSIQSSTATTVMTVSFVNAGILTLAQAISVIMGANIGTTATAWIMVLGGQGNYMVFVVYAAITIAMALIYSSKNKHKNIGEFIMGLSLMLLGLTTLSANAKSMNLGENEAILGFFGSLSGWGFGSYLLFLLIGGLLTCAVQSSAAIMAITMTLCSTGALDIYMGIALVMGENIGTTITSNIVAMSASTQARRAAMAHLIFNVFGVIWVLCIYTYFVRFVCSLVGYDPTASLADKSILNAVLAAFHTCFNVCNVLILIWCIKPIEKLVCMIIPDRKDESGDDYRLQFISGGILSTAELSVIAAKKEINLFAERMRKMFGITANLAEITEDKEFSKQFARVEKYETISDNMELEIARFLNLVSEGRLSSDSKLKIRDMLRQISEIESIGDSCFHLAKEISNNREKKIVFNEKQQGHIKAMFELCDEAIDNMQKILSGDRNSKVIRESYNLENEINHYRTQLKSQNVLDVNNGVYSYEIGTQYLNIICESEKLCDYVINIVDICIHANEKKAI